MKITAVGKRGVYLSDIDQRWLAKLRREFKKVKGSSSDVAFGGASALSDLIAWGEKAVARAKKAKGGR